MEPADVDFRLIDILYRYYDNILDLFKKWLEFSADTTFEGINRSLLPPNSTARRISTHPIFDWIECAFPDEEQIAVKFQDNILNIN